MTGIEYAAVCVCLIICLLVSIYIGGLCAEYEEIRTLGLKRDTTADDLLDIGGRPGQGSGQGGRCCGTKPGANGARVTDYGRRVRKAEAFGKAIDWHEMRL